jgi:hypothetical protein
LEAATPGPWIKAGPWPHVAIWHPTGEVDPETNSDTTAPDLICDVFRSFMNEHGEWSLPGDEENANAAFIASAPNVVSALLAENDVLRQMVREVCGIAEVIRDVHEQDSDGYQDDETAQRATREFAMDRISSIAREVDDE